MKIDNISFVYVLTGLGHNAARTFATMLFYPYTAKRK